MYVLQKFYKSLQKITSLTEIKKVYLKNVYYKLQIKNVLCAYSLVLESVL